MLFPRLRQRGTASRIFEPVASAFGSVKTFGADDVQIAVAIHIRTLETHHPARSAKRVKPPGTEITRVGRGFEPSDHRTAGLLRFRSNDQVHPISVIQIGRCAEHPHAFSLCRGHRLRFPRPWLQKLTLLGWSPVNEDRARATFATAHHVDGTVA